MRDLGAKDATALHLLVESGRSSAAAVTEFYLDRIRALDGDLKSYLRVDEAGARAAAAAVDRRLRSGESLPLAGVAVGIKDQLVTQGLETTCASKILRGFLPPYDATAVARLRQAGAVILGKLNQDEFAMGSSTEWSAHFPTKNPWDHHRVPGGSSGGSAAAVAAGLCALSLGTDTGGSVRQPAALCGVSGLRPTYGRVSRYGVVAFASSLDQIGPLGGSVRDLALALSVIGGPDEHDATCARSALPDYRTSCEATIRGLRIGVPRAYFGARLQPGVQAAVESALAELERQGARLCEIRLPRPEVALAAYSLLSSAEAASNLARYDGVRYGQRSAVLGEDEAAAVKSLREATRGDGFGPEVKRRLLTGTYILRAEHREHYYGRAAAARAELTRAFTAAFADCDVMATPTSPTVAFALGTALADPVALHAFDVYTVPPSLAGLPALSIPCGFAGDSAASPTLPVGLQLIAPPFAEERLFAVGASYQRHTDWHLRHPASYGAPC